MGRELGGIFKIGWVYEEKACRLDLRTPKSYDFKNSEERKYSILYDYAQKDNWKHFKVISISNIITSFIFEKGYTELEKYIMFFVLKERELGYN